MITAMGPCVAALDVPVPTIDDKALAELRRDWEAETVADLCGRLIRRRIVLAGIRALINHFRDLVVYRIDDNHFVALHEKSVRFHLGHFCRNVGWERLDRHR